MEPKSDEQGVNEGSMVKNPTIEDPMIADDTQDDRPMIKDPKEVSAPSSRNSKHVHALKKQ